MPLLLTPKQQASMTKTYTLELERTHIRLNTTATACAQGTALETMRNILSNKMEDKQHHCRIDLLPLMKTHGVYRLGAAWSLKCLAITGTHAYSQAAAVAGDSQKLTQCQTAACRVELHGRGHGFVQNCLVSICCLWVHLARSASLNFQMMQYRN